MAMAENNPASSAVLDRTSQVRAGEELDLDRLRAYLEQELGPPTGASAALSVEQFPGGYSNLTYLVRYGDRELVLRRPPFGSKVKSAHDMGREYRILKSLHPAYPKVPRPVASCEDESIIGARFYLMERIVGLILRRKPPKEIPFGPERMRALCGSFVDALVELHALDYQAIGLGDLGKPEGYVERQVSGWSRRYRDAQTDDIPVIERVMAWLAENQPRVSPPATIIHNDFKLDNLILDPGEITRIIGVLDWEMATIGDPLMDLGTTLCYWIEAGDPKEFHAAAFGPTTLPGSYTRKELAARYEERSGRDLSNIVFYYCFGLFKTAVVVQQIYYRYKNGLTTDARFAGFGDMARFLSEQADRYLGKSSL